MMIHMKELEYPFDAEFLIQNQKKIRRKLVGLSEGFIEKKIAILGGFTTDGIKKNIELFLLNNGIKPLFYESEYNKYYEDIMFENLSLCDFKPDIIYICTSNRNILNGPGMTQSKEEVDALFSEEIERLSQMWDKARDLFACPIIQNNYEMPLYRLLGNRDVVDYHGLTNFINRLNSFIYGYAQDNEDFFVCDLNYISADYGLREWSNPAHWYMYKYPMKVSAIPYLSYNVANIIKSIFGKNKKALVLDLDNTLWGGVISEDGLEGIKLGPEEPEGQQYSEFQHYIKKLGEIGVLLTVSSKNDKITAMKGLNHPYSELRPDDFICIKANWEQKDKNIVEIANELGVLTESLVFVDDNPTERLLINESIPEVVTPEMNLPQNYISILDKSGLFEVTYFSDDDLNRKDMYVNNIQRKTEESQVTNYSDFLLSLSMKAIIKNFEPLYFDRITQLTNKSNQFNLTTKRYTRAEIQCIADDIHYISLYGKLIDKFGDNGIVSIIIGRIEDNVCKVELWLMSCRVLKRNMEYCMMDALVRKCKERKISSIRGFYYPTRKNDMVKELYNDLDFTKISEDESGNTEWIYEIPTVYINKCKEIQLMENQN